MAAPAVAAGGAAARYAGGAVIPFPGGGGGQDTDGPKWAAAAAAAAAALLLLVLVPAVLVTAILGGGPGGVGNPGGLPAAAQPFVAMADDAAHAYNVSPFLLLAVMDQETTFGTSSQAGVHDGVNFAGCCAGPFQFAIAGGASNTVGGRGGTWATYRNAFRRASLARPARYPNQYGPHPNVYDAYDALYAAAAYFHDLRAGPQLDQRTFTALERYGGTPPASTPYARAVLAKAQAFEAAAASAGGTGDLTAPPGTGLARLIASANEISAHRFPYCWGGGHGPKPGPTPGISYCWGADGVQHPNGGEVGLDCSGSTRLLLVLAGYPDPGPIGSGEFGRYPSGPGRHVTIYYNAEHVFVTVDGRAWTTSQNNYRHGPGWTPHTTAGFAASHPPGL